MGSFLETMGSAIADTIIGKAVGAVSNKVGASIDAAAEYARKLSILKTFASRLIGLTEEVAREKCAAQNLKFRVTRRNDKDFSFGGRMEPRHDRILVEVVGGKVTKASLG